MVVKTEATSAEPHVKLCWDGDGDVVTDDEGMARLPAAGGGAAMLTKPVNKLSRGSAQRPLPLLQGSKVKRPL